jgi:hypothetical protein
MFNFTPTTTPIGSSDQDLHREFLENPDLFPEIKDPEAREEAILGFEQYLKIIDGIFMDQLRQRTLNPITEDNLLRTEWEKRFEKPANQSTPTDK